MTISVEEADVEKNLDIFVSLLNQNREKTTDRKRFEWLYLKNPVGKTRAWIVIEDNSGEPVAFTCVLPRRIRVGNEDIICWNCGDFSVNKKYRTLGIALKLRRKAKESVDKGEARCLYAHPNSTMQIVHDKVGHSCIGKMHRFAKILDATRYAQRKIKINWLASFLSLLPNGFFYLKDTMSLKSKKGYRLECVKQNRFGKEFDDFFEEMSSQYYILGDRSADYLNWRFSTNPYYKSETIIIRDRESLLGYLIFHVKKNVAYLADILCYPNAPIVFTILSYWFKRLRKRKVGSVSAILFDSNPLIPFFLKAGFRKRPEESSVYAYAGENDAIREDWLDGRKWYMTEGDRDI